METFEKLEVWKRGCRLSVDLYKQLGSSREFSFKDQVFRSSLSVPSNIAEGYERSSRKEYIRFLNIAKASCGELRTQLYIGIEAEIIDRVISKKYIQEATEISKMLQGLINSLSVE